MSQLIAQLSKEAEEIGLSNDERKIFIKERLKEERDRQERDRERQIEREREEKERERQIEREREEKERERQIEKEERERERQSQLEIERMKHELEMAKLSSSMTNVTVASQSVSKLPQLPPFIDGKDDLDSWLLRFERFAETNQWPRSSLSTYLSALISGRALDTFCRLSTTEAQDYDIVKKALQVRYNLTEDGYREKFRQCVPEDGESAAMFLTRMKTYLERWIELANVEKEYESLRDMFIKEQFVDICPRDLATHLKEKKLITLDNVAEAAESFLVARKRQLSTRKMPERNKNESDVKPDNTNNGTNSLLCWKCNSPSHKARDCKERNFVRNGGYQRNETTKQGSKRAGAVVVAKSTPKIDGQSYDQIDVKAEVRDGLLQVSMPVTSCGSCSEDEREKNGNLPVMRGFIGEQEVDVLRDTGCEAVVVKRKFVSEEQLTGRRKRIIKIDNTMALVDEALIDVRTPFFTGRVQALCLPEAICDLVIGNIEGARSPDNPDTEVMVGAVKTRAQAERKDGMTSLRVPDIKGFAGVDKKELVRLQNEDPIIVKLETKVRRDGEDKAVWFERQRGVLYRLYEDKLRGTIQKQVLLPSKLKNYVMSMAHDSIVGGHLGIRKTKDKVTSNFFWPGIDGDVTRYCRSCDVCQKTVNKGAVTRVPLQSIPVVDTPFKRVAVDLVGPISPPSESGHRYILTLVDYATRYPEAVPLKKIDTETVAEALVDIYSRIGIPEEILSDQGTQFVSDCMKEVCRLLGIKRSVTTPFHPSCNGLVEKFNSTLKKMLKRMCAEQPKQWHRYISPLLFAYREVPQESTKFAPFELMYGRSVRGPMNILRDLWTNEVCEPDVKSSYQYVLELRERLDETWKIAREELAKAQKKQKSYYDKKSKVRRFKAGDKVLVLLPTDSNKLLVQWKGPFEVVEVMGLNDYRVKMGARMKTLHANLLKKYVSRENDDIVTSEESSNPTTSCASVCLSDKMEPINLEETFISRIMKSEDTYIVRAEDNYSTDEARIGTERSWPLQQTAMAVVQDYEDDQSGSTSQEDLADLGSWGQRESLDSVQFGTSLSPEQRQRLEAVVRRYQTVFSDVPGCCRLAEHQVNLTSSEPVRQRPYAVPYALRSSLKEELEIMERQGIIQKSNSPYASPVVVVKKKDGSNRVCIDYRKLNAITEFDPHPAPTPAEIFQDLAQDKFFTRIDLSKGYWQIRVRDCDVPKTAFVTMGEHYEFLRMPFGMMNSGATLNRAVKTLTEGMENVTAYVDDLLVHTETFDEHVQTLDELLRRMERASMMARPSKCLIGTDEVDFVGHWLSRGTIGLHDDNVIKIRNAARPNTKKEVKSFLGLVGYYQEFVPNFAAISAPLTDLLRRGQPNKVEWGDAQEKAFVSLRQYLTSKPILQLPDFNKDFVLSTDASNRAIGCVLGQMSDGKLYPIAYASRKLLPREEKYCITEKECLAIIWAVKKFSLYLYGREFVLRTDHRSLEFLKSAKFENQRVMRWSLYLQQFRFRIEYVKGSENVGADFLSRVIDD